MSKAKNSEERRQSRNFGGPWRKTPGRIFGLGLIRLYQLSLSGFVGGHCRHLPTCSEYGYEAIARFGLWAGGFLTLFRLIRCGPFGTHGFDPAPRRLPSSYAPFAPWRLWRAQTAKTAQASGKSGGKQDNLSDKV